MPPKTLMTPDDVTEHLIEEYASGQRTTRYQGNKTRKMVADEERLERNDERARIRNKVDKEGVVENG